MKMHLHLILIAVGLMAFTAPAQTPQPAEVYDFGNDAPLVPLEVVTSGGRQKVADYLLGQTKSLHLGMEGTSLLGPQTYYYFDNDSLINVGYIHRDSFSELRDLVSRLQISGKLVPTPGGWYDAQVKFECRTASGRTNILGSGWLNINENKDGSLRVEPVETYVWIPEAVGLMFNEQVQAARWLGSQGEVEDLQVESMDYQSKVTIRDKMFDDGVLVISTYGPKEGWGVRSYNLQTGAQLEGKQFVALLGKSMSGDFIEVADLAEMRDKSRFQFYRNGNNVYGRFPTVEFKLEKSATIDPSFPVNVWGTGQTLYPVETRVKSMSTGQEFPVPAGYGIGLPPGKYKIFTRFNGVKDWLLDYNMKG